MNDPNEGIETLIKKQHCQFQSNIEMNDPNEGIETVLSSASFPM